MGCFLAGLVVWIGGLVDWWIGGLVGWWIGGLVDCWCCGLVVWWIGGFPFTLHQKQAEGRGVFVWDWEVGWGLTTVADQVVKPWAWLVF